MERSWSFSLRPPGTIDPSIMEGKADKIIREWDWKKEKRGAELSDIMKDWVDTFRIFQNFLKIWVSVICYLYSPHRSVCVGLVFERSRQIRRDLGVHYLLPLLSAPQRLRWIGFRATWKICVRRPWREGNWRRRSCGTDGRGRNVWIRRERRVWVWSGRKFEKNQLCAEMERRDPSIKAEMSWKNL